MVKLTENGILRINFRHSFFNEFRLFCNFECSYCIPRNQKVKPNIFTKFHLLQTKFLWDKLSKVDDNILVRVNFDGELLFDNWAKKCAIYINKLPNVKVLEIVTNNSIDPDRYLNEFIASKLSLHCSYHPEFILLSKFKENILKLKKAGCNVFVSLVCIPPIIKEIPKIYRFFKKYDINLRLQSFFTPNFRYLGKKYPREYTTEELKILRRNFYSHEEYKYFVEFNQTEGLDCYAGVDRISLSLDGTVLRCSSGEIGKYDNITTIRKKLNNLEITKWVYNRFLNKIYNILRKQFNFSILKVSNIDDLTSGKIKLKRSPYPCHKKYCASDADIIYLKEIRDKYHLSENFLDMYKMND